MCQSATVLGAYKCQTQLWVGGQVAKEVGARSVVIHWKLLNKMGAAGPTPIQIHLERNLLHMSYHVPLPTQSRPAAAQDVDIPITDRLPPMDVVVGRD